MRRSRWLSWTSGSAAGNRRKGGAGEGAAAVVRGAGVVVVVVVVRGPAGLLSRSRAESVVCWLLLLSLLAGVCGRDGGCRGRGEG